MASSDERHDFDIRDLLLYAPIGLVYEYQKIIPQLIKRGRSQVQLGMFIGRIAASKGTSGAEKVAADALTTMATIAARGVTEFGQVVGLAPPDDDAPPLDIDEDTPANAKTSAAETTPALKTEVTKVSEAATSRSPRLPIAGYDDLTAREVVDLLDDLTPAQQKRVRAHESKHRNRKTILAKLDRLEQA
jgi:hypothetical protein